MFDLMKLMKGFFDPEEFKDSNEYYCKKCNKHSKLTTKKSIVKQFPPYIIVTLKRFSYD
jgi:ubiquitin C-terminal hydrolase